MNRNFPKPDPVSLARADFSAARGLIYFNTSAHGLMPSAASEAVQRYVDDCIAQGGSSGTMRDSINRVRAKFAHLIGAEPDEIAITQSVSEGLNAVITSIPWQAGDNAVLSLDVEHPNVIYALYNMRTRYGIGIKAMAAVPDLAVPADAIIEAIDAGTRLVAVSSVTYTSGARTDLDRLAEACRERGVLLLVDGAQSIGVLDLDVRKTPIDALAIGASKYLCGPSGIGFLYVRGARAKTMQPGSLARKSIDLGDAHEGDVGGPDYVLARGARRFEIGSYNYMGATALEVALDLLGSITVPAIEGHVLTLSKRLAEGLRALRLPVLNHQGNTPGSHIVVVGSAVADAGLPAELKAIHDHLSAQNVTIAVRHGRLRFSFHLYNTMDEVESVLSMIGGCLSRQP